jgi:hypothetical protein
MNTKPITIKEARANVVAVEAAAKNDDHEAAHFGEDELRERVLHTIAIGKVGPDVMQKLARIALETSKIAFQRHHT